jgi:5-methylcytosine-specific restriction protein A
MPMRAKVYGTNPPPKPDSRPSASIRGYGRTWQCFRLAFLAERPLCEDHKARGETEAATEVHHLSGRGPNGPDGYNPDALRALCKRCHSARTARGE